MAKAKILQKKSLKRKTHILKKSQNRFKGFFDKLAGKELAIGISIGFVLMSLLMLFANNLKVNVDENQGMEIHAAADVTFGTAPGIGE